MTRNVRGQYLVLGIVIRVSELKKAFLSAFFTLATIGLAVGVRAAPRPATWAAAVPGTHLSNLYRIEPDLLRSAQPDALGFRDLATLGVKTVLDLRAGHADAGEAGKTTLHLLNVPMTAWSFRDDRVLDALRIVADKANRPLLVHCQKGADRTGAILALYRIVVQGWTREEALREMNEGGYHHSFLFRNLDRYVRHADIGALRRELGVSPPGEGRLAAAAPPGLLNRGPLALPTVSAEYSF